LCCNTAATTITSEQQAVANNPSHTPDIVEFNMEDNLPTVIDKYNIPAIEPNIWENVFCCHQNINQVQAEELDQHSSTGSSKTKSASNNPGKLDNISLTSLDNVYESLDPTMHGSSEEIVLNAEELVEQVVSSKFLSSC
jgi:hypothetical protein